MPRVIQDSDDEEDPWYDGSGDAYGISNLVGKQHGTNDLLGNDLASADRAHGETNLPQKKLLSDIFVTDQSATKGAKRTTSMPSFERDAQLKLSKAKRLKTLTTYSSSNKHILSSDSFTGSDFERYESAHKIRSRCAPDPESNPPIIHNPSEGVIFERNEDIMHAFIPKDSNQSSTVPDSCSQQQRLIQEITAVHNAGSAEENSCDMALSGISSPISTSKAYVPAMLSPQNPSQWPEKLASPPNDASAPIFKEDRVNSPYEVDPRPSILITSSPPKPTLNPVHAQGLHFGTPTSHLGSRSIMNRAKRRKTEPSRLRCSSPLDCDQDELGVDVCLREESGYAPTSKRSRTRNPDKRARPPKLIRDGDVEQDELQSTRQNDGRENGEMEGQGAFSRKASQLKAREQLITVEISPRKRSLVLDGSYREKISKRGDVQDSVDTKANDTIATLPLNGLNVESNVQAPHELPKKRGRGRPRKNPIPVAVDKENVAPQGLEAVELGNCDKPQEKEDVEKHVEEHVIPKGTPPTKPQKSLLTPEKSNDNQSVHGTSSGKQSPLNTGVVPHRVGLSRRARIAPLLRIVRK